ncbi:MAG: methionyl-tRNA formyltransferase [Deltaproteobacteria bacterium]|nr:MAG: methionyl-tRNA formyltransferase [Deltaproteobacteria bacterium]
MAKIIVFGQAQFGERVFSGLRERGHDILAVSVPPRPAERPPDPLEQAAREAGIPVVQRRSYKGEEAYAEVAPERADLAVLAYVTQIIPARILDAPRFASVCFHPSLLPAYRGGSAINWQIIRGETRSGVTLFRPDDGIDSGPIYLQREIEIGPDDSAGSFYYGKVFDVGVDATLEAVELILSGRAQATPQDESLATYDPLCRDEHAAIDWNEPTETVHNLIRGCDPSPGAHSRWRGETVRFYGSRRAAAKSVAPPGTVLAVGEEGIEVATADGSVRLAKMKAGGGKCPAAEAAASAGIEVGAVLGS